MKEAGPLLQRLEQIGESMSQADAPRSEAAMREVYTLLIALRHKNRRDFGSIAYAQEKLAEVGCELGAMIVTERIERLKLEEHFARAKIALDSVRRTWTAHVRTDP